MIIFGSMRKILVLMDRLIQYTYMFSKNSMLYISVGVLWMENRIEYIDIVLIKKMLYVNFALNTI